MRRFRVLSGQQVLWGMLDNETYLLRGMGGGGWLQTKLGTI